MIPIKVAIVCIGRFHHYDLARELSKRGMLERLFTGYPVWKLRDEGIPLDRVSSFPWLQTPYMALRKWKLMKEGPFELRLAWYAHNSLDRFVARNLPKCDLIFALSGSGLACGRAMQSGGGRYICDRGSSHIRFQNAILEEEFKRWGETFRGIDPRMIAKEEMEYESCDLITVPSTFAYRSFIQMGIPESKLRIVPYGVDLRRFEKVGKPPSDCFDILFVGNASFRKGVPYLLEAFKKFKHPKKRLTFVGAISPEVEHILHINPTEKEVKFLGPISQPNLKHLMSRSHVLVLPSIEEGLALVQAQALACGCPVIGTTNTGAEDLFTDGIEGFIVPIRDSSAIAERLQELADDRGKRQRMSEASLVRVTMMGGWENYGNCLAEVFQKLISGV